ncbi:phosphotransferase enzyme family protein [Candidatus Tisiphia endosymbiont of Mystacides longicornis]|uniref:phosphotransferase enzyme family protein n=1 Tax=Candidatus Tisiphia endosymbiont of Mystacides longicornis TaxID=3139330 RepID=UPI003CCADEBA
MSTIHIKKKYSQHLRREEQIVNIGDYIYRPAGFWTKQVHNLLDHIRSEGFLSAPKPVGFDNSGREIVSFLKGEVSNYPLSNNAASIKALTSAASLLRKYHDASQNFLIKVVSDEKCWQLPSRHPKEVICHGDFAPYNVVLNGEQAVGIIDFDTCHPGSRLWDVAYALYRWVPLTNPNNKDGFGSIDEQIIRACLFCQAYGLAEKDKNGMIDLIIERLQVLVSFMFSQAALLHESDFESVV